MRITIVRDDGIVGVDGVFRSVDVSGLGDIHAVQFDTVKGVGHIEYDMDLSPRPENTSISSIEDFQVFLDRWTAAAPPPPLPPTPPPPPVPPTPDEIQRSLAAAVQRHLDTRARERGYDNIFTACTYADEPAEPSFQLEGKAYRAWRSLVWKHCYDLLAEVKAGTRAAPIATELIAELPALVLP